MIYDIEILNWDNYNPKRDQKTYTWLRLQNDIATNQDLFGLTASQKFCWVTLLCIASKKNCGRFEVNIHWLSTISGVKKSEIISLFKFLTQKEIIRVHDNSLHQTTAEDSEQARLTTPTYERTNVRTNDTNEHVERKRIDAPDFESLYKKFPRKEGKAKGIEKCKAQIKTPEDFDLLSKAIDSYTAKKKGTETKFLLMFSTFMEAGGWRDWLDPETGTTKKPENDYSYLEGL